MQKISQSIELYPNNNVNEAEILLINVIALQRLWLLVCSFMKKM